LTFEVKCSNFLLKVRQVVTSGIDERDSSTRYVLEQLNLCLKKVIKMSKVKIVKSAPSEEWQDCHLLSSFPIFLRHFGPKCAILSCDSFS